MGTTILCFGDSNTWGDDPGAAGRLRYEYRWPTVLQRDLGSDYLVIPEGLNGRTTVFEDPFFPYRSGVAYLPMVLETHKPLDLVILMLGTNDVKPYFAASPEQIGLGADRLVTAITGSDAGPEEGAPQVLLIAPVPLGPFNEDMAVHFGRGGEAISKSEGLPAVYRTVARQQNVFFYDAAEAVKRAGRDGVHLDTQGHERLGTALADFVRSI